MSNRKKKDKPKDSFVVHRLEMRQSAAWRALPDHGRRVLFRLEEEHMGHAGGMNGRLACPYRDFERSGIPYKAISLAIRQCVGLGFLEITHQGTPSISQHRNPSRYRLTYVYGREKLVDGTPLPQRTDEWKRIETDEQAAAALASAAEKKSSAHVRRAGLARAKRAA